MKKIMFTLAAVACAVTTQAAQFSWGFSNVREGWDDSSTKADGTAYLFLVGGEVTEASIASAISSAADTTALASTLSGKAIDTQAVSGGFVAAETASGITATAPAQLFFVVVSDDGHVYQGAAATLDTIETLGATELAFGSQKSATSAAAAWSTVGGGGGTDPLPEPTSGLLLLVGGAVLALRRKQK